MAFTEKQEQAINDQGKDILVSASAGSGKTTVLVQRVINKILSGVDVSQLLIVTFTKAAAEEMKQRIKTELTQVLQNNPDRRGYLQKQLNQIDTANISTIDAFCLEVIHRFYYIIGLDPSFSILTDETQAALLKERALQDTEAEFLENKDQDFIAFYNNFAGDRDADAARNLLLDLYDFSMAKPNYRDWLQHLADDYQIDNSIIDSKLWQEEIKPYLETTFIDLRNKINTFLDNPVCQSKELAKMSDSFKLFLQHLTLFIKSLEEDTAFNDLREDLRNCQFIGSYRKSAKWDEDILDFYQQGQDLKKAAKNQIFEIFTAFFASDENEQIQLLKKGKQLSKTIAKTELALIDHFKQLKEEENLIDYSDMEQFAFEILTQDTSKSSLARDFYQNKFKEILVDEYQDINPLQETIIQTIKKDQQNTLFMVGDVKQSIYGFRQAEPSLFLKKYHDFGNSDQQTERIVLADNFRSTQSVTKIVNQLFRPIMTKEFGGINYTKEGQLVFGAKYYPDRMAQASEILFHEKDKENLDDNSEIDFSEIQMVIERIKQFKKEKLQVYDSHTQQLRPFKYSDIAILTRSRSNNLNIMQEFANNNLPLFITDAQNYFQTFELTTMINYLKIIDNPDQDIPLVAVLRSPLFNFKEPDLAKIRAKNKKVSFYNALLSYVSINDLLSKKIKHFLNQLDDLRKFATTHRISELIWSIYERSSLLEIMTSLPNGEQRRVNLEALYERANSFESAGFKGLYQFINFITRMQRSQKDLAQPLLTKEAGNAVRLMTIHGSKGLEFPIVFYLGMQHHYQMRDLTGNYVINQQALGLTIKEKQYRADSLVKSIGNIQKKRQLLEEEARILYVALTRAKQKLILVGDVANLDKKIQTWKQKLTSNGYLSLTEKTSANSPLSFIGPSLAFDQHLPQKVSEISSAIDQSQDLLYVKFDGSFEQVKPSENHQENETSNSLLNKTTKKLFDYKYPFNDASKTTAYQAVSEIKKAFNDPIDKELENSHVIVSTNRYLQPIDTKPNFLFETKFTGAEIGTATHLILQYYDYRGNGNDQQLENEIAELINKKKLNPEIVSSIKKDQINWFVHSDFAKKFWTKPENLKREVDFSSLLSAQRLFENFSDPSAKILVHGTIDGYFIDNDGIILFDYKTDHIDPTHLDLSINQIKAKYQGQLRLYERALNELGEKKVKSKYLILLDAKKVVELK